MRLIENNTCDAVNYSPSFGIVIYGVCDESKAGSVAIANNIIAQCTGYGLSLVSEGSDCNGYVWADIYNNGYYGNGYYDSDNHWHSTNKYPTDLEEDNAVVTNVYPFTYTPTYLTDYLDPSCPFVDAGWQYIEETGLIGMTTNADGTPDSNKVDLGFHFTSGHVSTGWPWEDWNYTNAGVGVAKGDINKDAVTDLLDLKLLTHSWLQTVSVNDPNNLYNANNDTTINFKDYAILAKTWFKIQGHPNIKAMVSGDSNSGYVNVGISNYGSGTQQAFLLVDGQYVGEMYWFQGGGATPLDTSSLGNGTHKLKVVAVDANDEVTVSTASSNVFNCPLQYCISAEVYDSGQPHNFCGYYTGANNISVKVYNEANSVVWSQTYSPQNLHGTIPTNITSSDDLYVVKLAETSTGGKSVTKPLAIEADPLKAAKRNIEALVVVASGWMQDLGILRKAAWNVTEAVKDALKARGISYDYLDGSDASYSKLGEYAATCPNIKYIYLCSHGAYQPPANQNVLRTTIGLSDGDAVSIKHSDPGAPGWCMEDGFGKNVHSMYMLGFNPGQLKLVFFDGCSTGHLWINGSVLKEDSSGQIPPSSGPHSDMSWALKMSDGIFQGWYGDFEHGQTTLFNKFAIYEWNPTNCDSCEYYLGKGDDLYHSLTSAISKTPEDPLGNGPQENFRLRGTGNIFEINLQP